MENNIHIQRTVNLAKHIQEHLGPVCSTVSFTTPQTKKNLTVIIVEPTEENDNYYLVTSGISENLSDKDDIGTEFVLGVEKNWTPPKDEEDFLNLKDSDKIPFYLLMLVAEYLDLTDVQLGPGHTIPMNLEELPNFSHLLINFTLIDPDFDLAELPKENEAILFLGLYLITEREFDLINKGGDRDDTFDELLDSGLSLVFNPERI